ncbi:O-antigen ligase family protein [Paenibacillus roseipurpureus]|uniref:O-antigen ligase family protein n=1 Tax=Paenibacillus roseopurpureus TaxID=2918901 RepID=A0AA96LQ48_9BACL|nr:O-antigen ligase family protein [Paenibacillus sp. MBLB1832]WNR43768.1 O-antigen ligase family protein [Paenibacillus sp. MBLB1832]
MIKQQIQIQHDQRMILKKALVVLVVLILISPILNNLTSPRVFNLEQIMVVTMEKDPTALLIRSAMTALLLFFSFLLIWPAMKQKFAKPELQLWVASCMFSCGPILSSVLGSKATLSPQWFVLPLCFTALLLLRGKDLKWFVSLIRMIALVYLYGSLIAALVDPAFAIEEYYKLGYFYSFRLHGIANLANHLAPMVIVFWLTNRIYEKKNTYFNIVHWLVSFTVLLLTQSKTTWVTFVVLFMFVFLATRTRAARHMYIVITTVIVLCGCLFIINSSASYALGLQSQDMELITSLTGRNFVWSYTIEIWKHNPLFGYGLDLWKDQETRLPFLDMYNWAPGQAHNQFFQTLGESGLIGVAGLVFYVGILIKLGWRYAKESKYLTIMMVLLLLIRGITESTLESNLFKENFLYHFMTFALLMIYVKREKERTGQQSIAE